MFMSCMLLSKGSRRLKNKVSVYLHLERRGGVLDFDLALGIEELRYGQPLKCLASAPLCTEIMIFQAWFFSFLDIFIPGSPFINALKLN